MAGGEAGARQRQGRRANGHMNRLPLEPRPRAVLFDLDDTLCDYSAAREARLRIAFSLGPDGQPATSDGRNLDRMVAESILTHPHGVDHFGELFSQHRINEPAAAQAAMSWYRHNRFHGLLLFPDAVGVLQAVRVATAGPERIVNRPIGIITNGPLDVQRAKIDLLGIRDLVDFVLISEEFGEAKPNRAIFEAALERAGVGPEEAVFIGDSAEHDMAGARNAGIRSVWINRHDGDWGHEGRPPDRQVRHVGEVPLLVGSVYGARE